MDFRAYRIQRIQIFRELSAYYLKHRELARLWRLNDSHTVFVLHEITGLTTTWKNFRTVKIRTIIIYFNKFSYAATELVWQHNFLNQLDLYLTIFHNNVYLYNTFQTYKNKGNVFEKSIWFSDQQIYWNTSTRLTLFNWR